MKIIKQEYKLEAPLSLRFTGTYVPDSTSNDATSKEEEGRRQEKEEKDAEKSGQHRRRKVSGVSRVVFNSRLRFGDKLAPQKPQDVSLPRAMAEGTAGSS